MRRHADAIDPHPSSMHFWRPLASPDAPRRLARLPAQASPRIIPPSSLQAAVNAMAAMHIFKSPSSL
jgi:hypothetical protein